MTTTVDPAADHVPVSWFWEAGGEYCSHGPEPDREGDAWVDWAERHSGSPQDVYICLDAPAGEVCDACSNEEGHPVSMAACRVRPQTRAKRDTAQPEPDTHQPITVWSGPSDCLERDCGEYWDDEGEDKPDIELCSHICEEQLCGACSTVNGEGYYGPSVEWPCKLAPQPADGG